jgi:diguanylate cyclase (GGDEF)-like protein
MLEGLDVSARGQFLQRCFHAIAHLDLHETKCLQLWEQMLATRRELSEQLGRPISLKTVFMDVLFSTGLIRVPVVMEYEEYRKLQVSAVTDPLTGLCNRRLFAEAFEKELTRARRYGVPLGLVVLDLHRFKEVNDKHGHPLGDDVLRATATTLRKALRTSDSAFRIGGDEFALLLPQTEAVQALALSRRVQTVFVEILRPLGLAFPVTMDHGVATFPQDGEQAEQLIRIADERLYRLKHAAHNQRGKDGFRLRDAAQAPSLNAPPTVCISSGRATEKLASEFQVASSMAAESIASQNPSIAAAAPAYAVQRKAERVSMAGTNAYAIVGEQGDRRARVIDLGFGGVALEFEQPEELRDSLLAILHVPILPPVRVFLKPVWSRRTADGAFRLGCHFVS